jgi:hypothetical protein
MKVEETVDIVPPFGHTFRLRMTVQSHGEVVNVIQRRIV